MESEGSATSSQANDLEISEKIDERMLQSEIGFCYDALYLADQNQDNKVDADEFVTFAQIMGPSGFLPDVDSYQELPLILQSNFIILACLCLQIPGFDGGNGIDPQCCAVDPHIDISGTQPGQTPNSRQAQYLYQVCFLTETSIDRLLLSATPTLEPTNSAPSAVITDVPTDKPSRIPTKRPSEQPTPVPTFTPTVNPTEEISIQPTIEPTSEPSASASDEPTVEPSDEPTVEPSERISEEPTSSPTDEPTVQPSLSPTGNPTIAPSSTPTETLSVAPTDKLTETTSQPSMQPSLGGDVSSFPTVSSEPGFETAVVTYGIAITNGNLINIPVSSYTPDLIQSMNIVAEDVANSMNLDLRQSGRRLIRRSLRLGQRKLEISVTVVLPTAIESLVEADCPSFVSPNNNCKTVTATVELNIVEDEDGPVTARQSNLQGLNESNAVKDLFQENLNIAIESGALQAALIEVNPDSVVTIITGVITVSPTTAPTIAPTTTSTTAPTTAPTSEPVPISPGGIAGIVLAGVGGLIIGFFVIAALRKQGSEESSSSPVDRTDENIEGDGMKEGMQESEENNRAGVPVVATTAAVGTTLMATTSSDYDNDDPKTFSTSASASSPVKKKKTSDVLYKVPGTKPTTADDASSAGESGWSSNQDGSSVDNSLDSIPQSNFSGIVPGSGAEGEVRNEAARETDSSVSSPIKSQQSSLEQEQASLSSSVNQSPSQERSYTGTMGTDGSMQSTYSELDEAINKGDWAAVGVTAALLASQAYTDDGTQGSSKQSFSRMARNNSTLNPERAAELDLLVEAGDWEGVVAAAAKYDAQEALRGDAHSSQNSESGSVVDSTAGSNADSNLSESGGGSSGGTAPSNMSGSQTIDTTTSPSTYTATGLTATSDTASTRSKARKLNEIRDEVEALVTAVVPEEADNVDEMMTQFRGREEELVETLRSMQERQVAQKARKESQKQAKRQAKEYVQDKKKQETFEAVDNTGNTADDIWMKELEDAPETSMDAIKKRKVMKDQLKEAISNEDWENVAEAAAGLSGHAFTKRHKSTKDSESIESVDINALVDIGDWDGVVAAASRLSEGSTNASSNEYTTEGTEEIADDSTIEQRRKRREERLREEEEALAQAEIWDAIADQTKVDSEEARGGSSNAGAAKMAADWAIDQSLAALKKAEEDHDDNSDDSGQGKKGDNESL